MILNKLTGDMIDNLGDEVDMIDRHLSVLRLIIECEPIGAIKISSKTSYPRHKIRHSLDVLKENDIIEPSDYGSLTTEQTHEFINNINYELDNIKHRVNAIKLINTE